MNDLVGSEAAGKTIVRVEEIDGELRCYAKDGTLLQTVTARADDKAQRVDRRETMRS